MERQFQPSESEQASYRAAGSYFVPAGKASAYAVQTREVADEARIRQSLIEIADSHLGTGEFFAEMGFALGGLILTVIGISALMNGEFLSALAFGGALTGGQVYYHRRHQNKMRAALATLQPNTRWIAPLLEQRRSASLYFGRLADECLQKLLPQLTREAFLQLRLSHQQEIYDLLRLSPGSEPLVLAAIAGLREGGGSEAIPYLECLTTQVAWLPAHRRIQAAALQSLSAIERRVAEEQAERERRRVEIERPRPHRRRSLTEEELKGVLPVEALNLPPLPNQTGATPAHKTSPEVAQMLKDLEEEQKRYRQPGMRFGFLIASWTVIVPYCGWQAFAGFMDGNWTRGALFGACTLTATQLHRYTLSIEQARLIQKLANSPDPTVVGKLAEALEWPEARIQRIAAGALTKALPRLNASDANRLNEKQRGCLYRVLKWGNIRRYRELMLAILKALEQVGDAAAVPAVKALAEGKWRTREEKAICDQAEICLTYLEKNALQNNYRATLLRPASAEDASPETLLRPVAHAPDTPPEQLLRPVKDSSLEESP